MAYEQTVRVTFKDKDSDKKYVAKKNCTFFNSLDEAAKALGEMGALNKVNEQIRTEFANTLRAKLKAKVTGESVTTVEDAEEVELD